MWKKKLWLEVKGEKRKTFFIRWTTTRLYNNLKLDYAYINPLQKTKMNEERERVKKEPKILFEVGQRSEHWTPSHRRTQAAFIIHELCNKRKICKTKKVSEIGGTGLFFLCGGDFSQMWNAQNKLLLFSSVAILRNWLQFMHMYVCSDAKYRERKKWPALIIQCESNGER